MSRFRPEVEAMAAYAMREGSFPVKVNQNEAPWDWPAEFKEEAVRLVEATAFHRYPPFDEAALTAALAERWGLEPESVLVGNGSNELLQALFLAALGPRRTVCLPSPGFALYGQLALLCGARALNVPMAPDLAYDPPAWRAALRRERPEVLLLCSPNNPTGTGFPAGALDALLDEAPGLVVVDEAYAEFSEEESARRLLPRRDNLVVLRTFSKAWAGAGLRLGYAMAAPSAALQLRKALLPYNVSPITAGLGALALAHAGWFEERVRRVVAERERLRAALGRLPGLAAYPSEANFFLVRLAGREAGQVHAELKARGVLVRDVSRYPMLEGCLRLSVGTPEENEAVVKALSEVLS